VNERQQTVISSANDPLRCVLVDPWARRVEVASLQEVMRECGCVDACGVALASLLGRAQRAYPVLDGSETLLVGTAVIGPRWTWSATIIVSGFGLIVGGQWAHSFSDSRASVADVAACVQWLHRRRAVAAAA
jgi:hypothetical protein